MPSVNPYAAQLPQSLFPLAGQTRGPLEQSNRSTQQEDLGSVPQQRDVRQTPEVADVRSRVDDLISQQVSNGRLTTGQASELRNVFADAFNGTDAQTASTPRETRSPGVVQVAEERRSPPPEVSAPPVAEAASDETTVTGAAGALKQFLNSLQDERDAQAATSYSSAGASRYAPTGNVNSLLFDFRT